MGSLTKSYRVDHPKYEVSRCSTVNRMFSFDDTNRPSFKGEELFIYRVTLYLIFSAGHVYTLYNPSDWIENINLMRESGSSCSSFTHDIFVSATEHPDIYKEIRDYVSATHSD